MPSLTESNDERESKYSYESSHMQVKYSYWLLLLFRYLINKYLGPYLDDSGILEQQIVSADSDISLLNVSLNIAQINELLEGSDLPFEFVDGFIGELTVTIPWKDLLKENCFFALDGLTITLQVCYTNYLKSLFLIP